MAPARLGRSTSIELLPAPQPTQHAKPNTHHRVDFGFGYGGYRGGGHIKPATCVWGAECLVIVKGRRARNVSTTDTRPVTKINGQDVGCI